MFYLKTLGSPKLLVRGEPVRLFRKSMAIFVFLGLESAKAHERAALADLFWPNLTGIRAEHSLSQALYSLRKVLESPSSEPCFLFERTTVRFNPQYAFQIDALLLSSPPAGCPVTHDAERCRSCAEQMTLVLREIRGPFLEGLSLPDCEEFETWSTGMEEDLLVRCRREAFSLVSLCEREGNLPEAIVLLEAVLKMDPLDEEVARLLMNLHARDGNRRAAELVFDSCRKVLREEVSVEPEEETQFLAERIRSGKIPGLTSGPSPRREEGSPFTIEIRPATALFIEILDDQENIDNLPSRETGRFLGVAMEKARELGGVVVRTHGYSFLAFFGLKGSSEGAARKAARTAVELLGIFREKGAAGVGGTGLRGGLQAGRIFVGPSLVSPDPAGSVSRPAMSLAMQAREGEILLTKSTEVLLKGEFLTVSSGEVRVLGEFREGFRLLGFSGRGDLEGFGSNTSRKLFGRDLEQGLFRKILCENQGGALIVEGEAGIGKTALVRAFLDEARVQKRLVRTIECTPQYADSPYFPLIRMMRGLASVPEECGREEAYSRILSYVRVLGLTCEDEHVATMGAFFSLAPHPDYPLPDLPPAAMRARISDLMMSIFKRRAVAENFLLSVEDLHWMDSSTGDLLFRIFSDPVLRGNALIILTTRTGEEPSWLASIQKGASIIRLLPLGAEDSRKMVRFLGEQTGLSEEAVEGVAEIAAGVPLFLEELTRMLSDSSVKGWKTALSLLPGTLSEVLTSRLDRLSGARALLQRASVAGRIVPLELLVLLSPDQEELFEDHLEKCGRSGLVEKRAGVSGDVIEFRHALIQDAAYRSLHHPDRVSLHHRVAEILENRFPEQAAATPEVVAGHFEKAGVGDKALEWYGKAASAALSRGSLFEAEVHARAMVAILSWCPAATSKALEQGKRALRALTHLGHILINRYGYSHPEVAQTFRKAMDLVDAGLALPEDSFFAFYGFWDSLWGGDDIRESRKVADTLVAMASVRENPVFWIAALYADGTIALWEGRFAACMMSLDGCLGRAQEQGRTIPSGSTVWEVSAVQAVNFRRWCVWFLGKYRSTQEALDQVLEQAKAPESSFKRGQILVFALTLIRLFRRPEQVLSLCDRLRESNEEMQTEGWTLDEYGYRGWAMVHLGHPEGIGLVKKSVAMTRQYRRMVEGFYLAILADCYLVLGETVKCGAAADSALRFSRRSGVRFFDSELYRLKGEAAFLSGDPLAARSHFEKALDLARKQGARAWELRVAVSMGRLLEECGERGQVPNLFSSMGDLLFGPESDPDLPDIKEALFLLESIGSHGER